MPKPNCFSLGLGDPEDSRELVSQSEHAATGIGMLSSLKMGLFKSPDAMRRLISDLRKTIWRVPDEALREQVREVTHSQGRDEVRRLMMGDVQSQIVDGVDAFVKKYRGDLDPLLSERQQWIAAKANEARELLAANPDDVANQALVQAFEDLASKYENVEAVADEMVYYILSQKPGNDMEAKFVERYGKDLIEASTPTREFFSNLLTMLQDHGMLDPVESSRLRGRFTGQKWANGGPNKYVAGWLLGDEKMMAAGREALEARAAKDGGISRPNKSETRSVEPVRSELAHLRQREFTIVARGEYDKMAADAEAAGEKPPSARGILPFDAAAAAGFGFRLQDTVIRPMRQETRLVHVDDMLSTILHDDHEGKLYKRFESAYDAREEGFEPMEFSVVASQYMRQDASSALDLLTGVSPALDKMLGYEIDPETGFSKLDENGRPVRGTPIYFHKEIAGYMKEFARQMTEHRDAYDLYIHPLVSAWRSGKTVLNAGSHFSQHVGNIAIALMHPSITPADVPRLLKSGWDIMRAKPDDLVLGDMKKSELDRRMIERRIITASPAHVDAGIDMGEFDPVTEGLPGMFKRVMRTFKNGNEIERAMYDFMKGTGKAIDKLRFAYSFSDNQWRYAIFKDQYERAQKANPGADVETLWTIAGDKTDEVLPNYANLSPTTRTLNKYIPFYAFTASMADIYRRHMLNMGKGFMHTARMMSGTELTPAEMTLAKQAGTQSMKFAAFAATAVLFQAMAQKQAGYSDEEMETINENMRGFNVWVPNPLGQEPFTLDMTYIIPMMDFVYPKTMDQHPMPYEGMVQQAMTGLGERIANAPMITDHPFLSLWTSTVRNQDAYFGSQIYNPSDPAIERLWDIGLNAYYQLVPGVAGYQLSKIVKAIRGEQNFSQTGPRYTVPQAVASAVGVKWETHGMEEELAKSAVAAKSMLRNVMFRRKRVERAIERGKISQEEGYKQLDILDGRIDKIERMYQSALDQEGG